MNNDSKIILEMILSFVAILWPLLGVLGWLILNNNIKEGICHEEKSKKIWQGRRGRAFMFFLMTLLGPISLIGPVSDREEYERKKRG